MPSCLGLYIEDNLIKYAKVSKNNDILKVDSFGVKFYETLAPAIKQIVEETYSFKVPISINTTEEWYNEIQVFSLLSKGDMTNAIKTEFENICYMKEINKNIYEQKHIFANENKGDDRIKVIHIAVPKTSIEQRKNQFADYKINNISPVSVSIANIVKKEKKQTVLVVNIEKDTTITKITNGSVASIEELNYGAQEILEKINKKENSYSKAYEICKSSTIYTETDRDLQYEENEYLEDIMPTLYKIVSRVREVINESFENIEKVYITGTGSLVNNIDIYFQDNLKDVSCEILKPDFVSNNAKINIKDYIEVNSAIAIAIQGIEKGNGDINFKSESKINQAMKKLNSNVPEIPVSKFMKNSVNPFFEKFNRGFDMLSITSIMIVVMYFAGVIVLNAQLENKTKEANGAIEYTNAEIAKVQEYNTKFDAQKQRYETLITNIQNLNDTNSEDKRYRNTIPNLLNNIMAVIPRGVQLTSIKNTLDTHVVIRAKSTSYEQVAYLKAKLKTEGILENVVSDTGTLVDDYINVTIEGELP